MQVLLIIRDEEICRDITITLAADGSYSECVDHAWEGMFRGLYWDYDLIIIDDDILEDEEREIFEVLSRIRSVAILILAEPQHVIEQDLTTEFYADYCLLKPFTTEELFERISAVCSPSSRPSIKLV